MTMKKVIPLVKVPDDIQIVVYLIIEELKSRKLFSALREVGLDDCYFQVHLDSLIMRKIGLDDGQDETSRAYSDIMDKRARKIEADRASIVRQAWKAYHELTNEKKRLKKG